MPSVPSRPRESEAWHRVTQGRGVTRARPWWVGVGRGGWVLAVVGGCWPWWVGVGHSMYVAIARVAAVSSKHCHSKQKQQAWAQSGTVGAGGKRHACSA